MLNHQIEHSRGQSALTAVMGLLSAMVAVLAMVLLWLNPILLPLMGPLVVISAIASTGFISAHLWRAGGQSAAIASAATLCVVDLGMTIGSPIFLAVKGITYLIAIVIGLRMLRRSNSAKMSLGVVFLIYACFAWLSVLISPHPFANAHTGLALVGIAFAALTIERLSHDDALKVSGTIAVVIGIGCLISIALYMAFPGLVIAHNVAGTGRTGGIFGSPNSFGGVAVVGTLLNLIAIVSKQVRIGPRWLFACSLAACAGALILSGSRTAALSLVLVLGVTALVLRPRISVSLLLVGSLTSFALELFDLLAPLVDGVRKLISRERSGADLQTLTGRLAIWEFAFNAWLKEPWFGYGLGESRQLISEGWANRWGGTTGSAHNLLLESLLNVGLIGTIVLAGIVLACLSRLLRMAVQAHQTHSSPMLYISVSLLAFALLQGITEKSFGGTASMATSALALAIGYLGRQTSQPPDSAI